MDLIRKTAGKLQAVKEKVMGGHTSEVFDPYKAQIMALESLVRPLKAHFNQYAESMTTMSAASVKMADKVQVFYRKSPNRQASVNSFCDGQFTIENVASEVFKNQFAWEVLKKFDAWEDDIAKVKQQVEYAEQLQGKVDHLFAKVESLKDKGKEAWEEQEATLKVQTATLAKLKTKLDEDVKVLIDDRFQRFDGLFVTIMECQMDFYKKASETTETFRDKVENYRKRFPRRVAPGSGMTQGNPASANNSNETPDSSNGHAKPTAQAQAQAQAHSDSSDDEDHDRHVDMSQAESQAKTTKPQQARVSSDDDDEDDYVQGEQMTIRNAPSQSKVAPSPSAVAPAPAAPAAMDILGFDFSNVAPAAQAAPNLSLMQVSQADPLDFFAAGAAAAPAPSKKDTRSAVGDDPMGDIFGAVPKAPAKLEKQNSGGLSFFDPYAKGKADAAKKVETKGRNQQQHQSPKLQQPPSKVKEDIDPSIYSLDGPQAADDGEQDLLSFGAVTQGGGGGANEQLDELRRRQSAEERLQQEKKVARDDLKDILDKWEMTPSKERKDIRSLLSNLDSVLWPVAKAKWKKVSLADMLDDKKVKLTYYKAVKVVHPDRLPTDADAADRVSSERVFNALNQAFKKANIS